VASLSQGRTAAAQCGLFTYKSVPVIFEPPCILLHLHMHARSCGVPRPTAYEELKVRTFRAGFSQNSYSNFKLCWPCISLEILGNNQIDALIHVFIYFMSLHVSIVTALIIRRSKCINTSFGIIIRMMY